jgi:hypothetical protein
MNSRLIRVSVVVIVIAVGLSASYLLNNLDRDLATQRSSADVLREQSAAVLAALADVRAGQVAYVARGQSEAFWMSRVESLLPALRTRVAEFGSSLTSPAARSAFEPASAALDTFLTLDGKVREFMASGSSLLAAAMIFSDGLESMTTASAQVTAALHEELQHRSGRMAALRSQQLAVLGGGAGVILLFMAGLALTGAAAGTSAEPVPVAAPPVEPVRFEAPLPRARDAVTPKLLSTAQLCRELARVDRIGHLPGLLERAARVLDASGIIVWVAEPSRQRLVAALSHGYDDRTVAGMGSIHRDANNAAAAAYRTSEVRTVAGDTSTSGAIIVPLMTSDGCVGVLSAEMRAGAEKDESAQALSTIFAAQLATLVATPPNVPEKIAAQA